MDKTTDELVKLYTYNYNKGLLQYLSQYHMTLVQKLFGYINANDICNDDYKSIRNRLYSIMILLANSTISRSNSIEFCVEVIKDHPDLSPLHGNIKAVVDSFDGWNRIDKYDYSYVEDLLLKIIRLHHGRDMMYKELAKVVLKYDHDNFHCNSLFGRHVDINIVDVVASVYKK